MANINRLLASGGNNQNLAASFIGGSAARQNATARDLQNTSAQNQLDKQANVNRLLQQQAQQILSPQPTLQSGVAPTTGAQTGQPDFTSLLTNQDKQQVQLMVANQDIDGLYKLRQSVLDRSKPDPEFLKEERKVAAQDVRSFNNQAREMRTSYGKLQGLADQARSGDRGARNAMTVAVGRLMSPGIFTETEASALSGGQNTLQGILAAFAGKGVDVAALQRNIDPYGDNFNVEGLLNIGSTIVASSRQPLIDKYEGSRNRATTSEMSERAFNTNFGDNTNYNFLKEFKQGAGGQDAVFEYTLPTGDKVQKPVQQLTIEDADNMSDEDLADYINNHPEK